jgi:hypothetical protein
VLGVAGKVVVGTGGRGASVVVGRGRVMGNVIVGSSVLGTVTVVVVEPDGRVVEVVGNKVMVGRGSVGIVIGKVMVGSSASGTVAVVAVEGGSVVDADVVVVVVSRGSVIVGSGNVMVGSVSSRDSETAVVVTEVAPAFDAAMSTSTPGSRPNRNAII